MTIDLSLITQNKINLLFIKLLTKRKAFKFHLIMFSTKVISLSDCTTSMNHNILSLKQSSIFHVVLFYHLHFLLSSINIIMNMSSNRQCRRHKSLRVYFKKYLYELLKDFQRSQTTYSVSSKNCRSNSEFLKIILIGSFHGKAGLRSLPLQDHS